MLEEYSDVTNPSQSGEIGRKRSVLLTQSSRRQLGLESFPSAQQAILLGPDVRLIAFPFRA
jgi:hypothetical protein